jgi:hypothetical protein
VDAKVPDAAVALTVGVLSNTILKLGTALAIGRGRFRIATAVTLAAMAGATILALVAQWPER